MYNLNVSLSAPPLLSVEGGSGLCTTPRTPEILNSLMAMTNPLEYSYPASTVQQPQSSQDSHSSSSGSPLDSPAGIGATPSVQQTCSQLIKAGVKLLIQNKRKQSCGESSGSDDSEMGQSSGSKQRKDSLLTSEDDIDYRKSPRTGLTPEDEDRRRRRRERNKIAATKCRMKKRERTVNLVHESEVLETQNIDLKTQVRDLEAQRRKLLDVLQSHVANCVHQGGYQPLPSLSTLRTCKYLSDLSMSEQQRQQQQLQNDDEQTEIKYSHVLKEAAAAQQQQHQPQQQQQQPLPNANHILPGYCKTSPASDIGYVMSPDSGFVKSPADMDVNSVNGGYKDYIPNCDTSTTPDREFLLKNELIDSSPYTTVQSADRFLFENSDNMDRLTPSTAASIKDHHHIHQQHHQHQQHQQHQNQQQHQQHQHFEYSGNFDGTILSKADFLSQHSEYLSLGDGVESQFTDLDSGVTTYTNMTNGGCLA